MSKTETMTATNKDMTSKKTATKSKKELTSEMIQRKLDSDEKTTFFFRMYGMVMALVAGGYLAFTASRIKANALDQGIPAYYVDFLFFMMGLGVVIATYGGIKALMGDGITFAGKEKRDNLKKMQKKLQSKSL